MKKLQHFLARVSGVQSESLEQMSPDMIRQRSIMGGAMIMSVLMISLGFMFGITTGAGVAVGIPAGIIIAIFLLWLEQYLIVSLDQKKKKTVGNLLFAVGIRVLLMVPLSIISSTALQMHFYSTEIENQITQNRLEADQETRLDMSMRIDSLNQVKTNLNEELVMAHNDFQAQIEDKQSEISKFVQRVQEKEDKLVLEIEGKLKRSAGYGDAAKAKEGQIQADKDRIAEMQAELETFKTSGTAFEAFQEKERYVNESIAFIDVQIEDLQVLKSELLDLNQEMATLGFQDQYLALAMIKEDGKSGFFMGVLFFLFLTFELAPILLKLSHGLKPTDYEKLLHDIMDRDAAEQKKQHLNSMNDINAENHEIAERAEKLAYDRLEVSQKAELEIQEAQNHFEKEKLELEAAKINDIDNHVFKQVEAKAKLDQKYKEAFGRMPDEVKDGIFTELTKNIQAFSKKQLKKIS